MSETTATAWAVGYVICLVCRYRWLAVRPVDTEPLECPQCHLMAGTAALEALEQLDDAPD